MLLFSVNKMTKASFCKNLKIKVYKTIILPVMLNRCETWSFALTEEWGMRNFIRGTVHLIYIYVQRD